MTKPAVPEASYADIGDGLRVHYHEAGDGDAVLFLHGSGPGASGWSNFRRNYPYFAEHGFRALVPDTLGFGYSSKPDIDYPLDFLAGGVKRFCDAVGVERCAVVGNSHGGALGIQLALMHPELVDKLVLMAPGGLEQRETYMQMRGIKAMIKAVYAPGGITADSMRRVFEKQLHDTSLITDAIIAERFEMAQLQLANMPGRLKVPHMAPKLAELECPVFGLWGRDDLFCPVSGATTLLENCADVRVLTFANCGHWVMVERTDVFNRLCVDFLRNG